MRVVLCWYGWRVTRTVHDNVGVDVSVCWACYVCVSLLEKKGAMGVKCGKSGACRCVCSSVCV